ncbi:MAG: hypothetical protein PHD05_02440 [Sphaerochaetaceae bacterium]|nr:hypothetical protein [Sphaerochaetaceae bacterium]
MELDIKKLVISFIIALVLMLVFWPIIQGHSALLTIPYHDAYVENASNYFIDQGRTSIFAQQEAEAIYQQYVIGGAIGELFGIIMSTCGVYYFLTTKKKQTKNE